MRILVKDKQEIVLQFLKQTDTLRKEIDVLKKSKVPGVLSIEIHKQIHEKQNM